MIATRDNLVVLIGARDWDDFIDRLSRINSHISRLENQLDVSAIRLSDKLEVVAQGIIDLGDKMDLILSMRTLLSAEDQEKLNASYDLLVGVTSKITGAVK